MNALQKPVLVLNRSWQPVHVSTVARAMVLLWKEAARIVDVEDYQTFSWEDWSKLRPAGDAAFIQSATYRLRLPEVITLTGYDKLPTKAVTFSRRNIFKRDRFQCQYCGKNPDADELTIDHVNPRAAGGISSWTNCVLSCIDCNKKKRDRTPVQAGMRLKKEPVCPVWKPVYANHNIRLASWSKFISEVYWNAELQK